ncbi:helix-turn-helix domain-containing protein [Streptomyces europaeiscabiei]|uniref:helix-turn-helix transcriptional regulator n=1 Tax=Streptomyces europaeiscabiei TaxID=146819 RepID=UPI0029AD7F43|nr:helix-turn-helix domain-containing protein [Streptomyces europaeiscabiei]MDX3634812.1 helix-turn-helix domain-containing protein [Streptomyces europaeiscabiei]MDX3652768.1 helix-turn-helix domain-containing protein [Streptomyces europaeiscabiei]
MAAPTLTEIREWPAVVSVPQAAAALGCSRSTLYEAIKSGQAPVRTLSYGRRVVCVTASIVAALEAT